MCLVPRGRDERTCLCHVTARAAVRGLGRGWLGQDLASIRRSHASARERGKSPARHPIKEPTTNGQAWRVWFSHWQTESLRYFPVAGRFGSTPPLLALVVSPRGSKAVSATAVVENLLYRNRRRLWKKGLIGLPSDSHWSRVDFSQGGTTKGPVTEISSGGGRAGQGTFKAGNIQGRAGQGRQDKAGRTRQGREEQERQGMAPARHGTRSMPAAEQVETSSVPFLHQPRGVAFSLVSKEAKASPAGAGAGE